MAAAVRIGQVWRLGRVRGVAADHVEVRVEKVGRSRVVVLLPTGQTIGVGLRMLERGLRGTRLLKDPQGRDVPPRVKRDPLTTKAERRSASDLRKDTPPKGTVVLRDKDRLILALKEKEQLSCAVIAERLGMSMNGVKRCLQRGREARGDARALGGGAA